MSQATLSDELVSWEPIAEKFSLRERAFRKLHAEGLPHYRINARVYRYRWSEIEQWLAEKEIGANERATENKSKHFPDGGKMPRVEPAKRSAKADA